MLPRCLPRRGLARDRVVGGDSAALLDYLTPPRGGGGAIREPRIAGHWYCAAATPQCPTPRPDLGTSCDSDASCQYGTACGCGEELFCTGGVWQGYSLPPCP
jgi:hypothetical protein